MPMLLPAPGLFSITICWPHTSESRLVRMRATTSVPPPGGNGTTRRTKRFGQDEAPCAPAWRAKAGARAAAAQNRAAWRRVIMRSSQASLVEPETPLAGGRSYMREATAARGAPQSRRRALLTQCRGRAKGRLGRVRDEQTATNQTD